MEIKIGDDDGVIVTHEMGCVRIESFGNGLLSDFEVSMVNDAIGLVSKYLEEADKEIEGDGSQDPQWMKIADEFWEAVNGH